jgi:hypothetical protein
MPWISFIKLLNIKVFVPVGSGDFPSAETSLEAGFSAGDFSLLSDSSLLMFKKGYSLDNDKPSLGSEDGDSVKEVRFFNGFRDSLDGDKLVLFLPLNVPCPETSIGAGDVDFLAGLSSWLNALGDRVEVKRLRAGEDSDDFLALLVLREGESADLEGDLAGERLGELLVLRAGESTDLDGDFAGDLPPLRVFLAGESMDGDGESLFDLRVLRTGEAY